MKFQHHRLRRNRRTAGTALILVLAALVLISALVLTFLNNSSLSRIIAYSSAGQARADQLSQTALATIVGDLREEIVAGSKIDGNPTGAAYSTNGIRVYVPQNNTNVVPCRVAPAVDLAFPNLVKISWSTNASWSGSSYLANNTVAGIYAPVRSLPANSTTSASLNQRSISNARWNQHYLLGTNVPGTWQAPDWVIITRSGAVTNASSGTPTLATLKNPAVSNPYRAIGRYAYAIYNEGGLIDINVAGNTLTLPASQNTQRGRLNQIELGQLYDSSSASPLIPNPSTLLAWRSPVSGSNTNSAPGSGGLFDPQQTFLDAATNSTTSDQKFVTRHDLISYANANPSVITTQALQYLTTFSRNVNSPSWTPTMNGPAGGVYNYQSNAESTAATTINRDLANVRFANGGTIAAIANTPAYTVTAGQPLLIQRFPLSRLLWIGRNGPNGATAADIKRAFGLVYVSRGIWNYVSPDNTDNTTTAVRIKSLNEVAALSTPRQPDFFELLQAGVLNGSLGLGNQSDVVPSLQAYRTCADTRDMDRSFSRQLMQIGVNLIDQVQPDNWPTTVLFNWFQDPALSPSIGSPYTPSSTTSYLSDPSTGLYRAVVGVTDIPYLYKIYQTYYQHPALSTQYSVPPIPVVGMFQMVEMWNPHQTPVVTPTSGPTTFRVRVETGASVFNSFNGSTAYLCSYPFSYTGSPGSANGAKSGPQEIDFVVGSGNTFRSPSMLCSANSPVGPTAWAQPGYGPVAGNVWMIPGGSTVYPPASQSTYNFAPVLFSTQTPPTYRFDYKDESGNWSTYPYQLMPEFCYFYDDRGGSAQTASQSYYGGYCRGTYRTDPRGERLGLTDAGGAWVFNALIGSNSGSYFGRPTSHPYAVGNYYFYPGLPIDPGGLFSSWYDNHVTQHYYSNLTWNFNNYVNYDNAGPPGYGIAMGSLAFNVNNDVFHSEDSDGVVRSGDYIGSVTSVQPTNPGLVLGTAPCDLTLPNPSPDPRPIILHRPFRSVAEMGYAFRDTPWKTLDLFSSNSADAALLDLFTVNDSVVLAGTVDLNTRQVPVLQAVLQGTMQTEATSTVLTTAQANSLAQSLAVLTGGGADGIGPLGNVSELATRFLPTVPTTVAPWIKTQREAAVRTLAQIGNVRVWNLLIDLMVQSGRYPASAAALNNFVVEGERHYWLHVAIDRTTGKVIDQSLEPVLE